MRKFAAQIPIKNLSMIKLYTLSESRSNAFRGGLRVDVGGWVGVRPVRSDWQMESEEPEENLPADWRMQNCKCKSFTVKLTVQVCARMMRPLVEILVLTESVITRLPIAIVSTQCIVYADSKMIMHYWQNFGCC